MVKGVDDAVLSLPGNEPDLLLAFVTASATFRNYGDLPTFGV